MGAIPVMPTRILIVGGGGREHALAWKLAAEPGVNEVVVAPGSDAIALEPRVRRVPDVDPLDPEAVVAVARQRAAELVVVGPEAPLGAGVADGLTASGIRVFGPSAAAARIETSKAFCHDVAEAAGVAMARAASFDDPAAAAAYARKEAARRAGRVVVKADGLAAGKGVVVAASADEAIEAIDRLFATGTRRVVIEEWLEGREASVIALSDGNGGIVAFPAARDHKRLLDGDRGPNTGGMGAYTPLPDFSEYALEPILDRVHRPILAELRRRGTPFIGFLYAGLILTDAGPRLLECNARLGDPEAQVLLPQVAVPLGPLLLAAANGSLPTVWGRKIPTLGGASVGIVLASAGYPDAPAGPEPITGVEGAEALGATVFHAATRAADGGWQTAGGRVLTVVARGDDITAASLAAERAADAISWPGMQRRHDIGWAAAGAVGAVS
ncbi:MAG TPA: phosphoribosylamine--glycine ligase [Candidatus Limnocylindrales bacterium]|nr:phosphoribosylamine--glycine ligase [Candidatus Limnocylindrales bacterium]